MVACHLLEEVAEVARRVELAGGVIQREVVVGDDPLLYSLPRGLLLLLLFLRIGRIIHFPIPELQTPGKNRSDGTEVGTKVTGYTQQPLVVNLLMLGRCPLEGWWGQHSPHLIVEFSHHGFQQLLVEKEDGDSVSPGNPVPPQDVDSQESCHTVVGAVTANGEHATVENFFSNVNLVWFDERLPHPVGDGGVADCLLSEFGEVAHR